MTERVSRPIGVTIIAILTIIIGIIAMFGGISIVVIVAFLSLAPISLAGIIAAIVGAVLLAIGIGYIVMSYGLLNGKGWAWTITIILVIIGIGIEVLSAVTSPLFNASFINTDDVDDSNYLILEIIGSIIVIAINVLILYYLFRPHVKSYFGKTQQQL